MQAIVKRAPLHQQCSPSCAQIAEFTIRCFSCSDGAREELLCWAHLRKHLTDNHLPAGHTVDTFDDELTRILSGECAELIIK
jgi:hypothetical protein